MIVKACTVLGIERPRLRLIPTTVASKYAMTARDLEAAIDADKDAGQCVLLWCLWLCFIGCGSLSLPAGLLPFFAMGTMGSTSSCAMDPLRDIGKVCNMVCASNLKQLFTKVLHGGNAGLNETVQPHGFPLLGVTLPCALTEGCVVPH